MTEAWVANYYYDKNWVINKLQLARKCALILFKYHWIKLQPSSPASIWLAGWFSCLITTIAIYHLVVFFHAHFQRKWLRLDGRKVTLTILPQRDIGSFRVSSLSGLTLSFLCRLSSLRLGSISALIPCSLSIKSSIVSPSKWWFKGSLSMSWIKRLNFMSLWDGQQSKTQPWLSLEAKEARQKLWEKVYCYLANFPKL